MSFLGDEDPPGMREVPLAYDDTGTPIEWMWVPVENADAWDARKWHPQP
ncbi:hypothetical protein [Leifsonia poae]